MLPTWQRESGTITYIASEAMLTTVEVRAGASSFEIGTSRDLFSVWGATGGCMAPDGQRGVLVVPAVENEARQLALVLNWRAGLERR
jgi:hypothetical protein